MFAFVLFDLVSLVLPVSQEIGCKERLRNGLFCVRWDVKPKLVFLSSSSKKCQTSTLRTNTWQLGVLLQKEGLFHTS